MRRAFAEELYEIMKIDDTVYLFVGDIGFNVFNKIKQDFPDRCINMGVCEQATVGMCAGLALSGLKPYFYTITPFIAERALEQIKIEVNLNKTNVKLIGYDDYPDQGPTHEVTDDGKFMNMFKNIKCYWPKTSKETKESTRESYNLECPTFIRLICEKGLE